MTSQLWRQDEASQGAFLDRAAGVRWAPCRALPGRWGWGGVPPASGARCLVCSLPCLLVSSPLPSFLVCEHPTFGPPCMHSASASPPSLGRSISVPSERRWWTRSAADRHLALTYTPGQGSTRGPAGASWRGPMSTMSALGWVACLPAKMDLSQGIWLGKRWLCLSRRWRKLLPALGGTGVPTVGVFDPLMPIPVTSRAGSASLEGVSWRLDSRWRCGCREAGAGAAGV